MSLPDTADSNVPSPPTNEPVATSPITTTDDSAALKKPAAVSKLGVRAKKTRVIVLGAGMAGLAAARYVLYFPLLSTHGVLGYIE